ncbi:hypothetical protein NONO_c15950 [Nocardia nova SH22a]|uniref:Uncharacterized protein n=1 Tax=Nocardia nova SH22a TaxID=1415166 RepID=W5TGP7_9NOCA|nr:hypothetical protein [Nocardia nova]AHH16396.1 hypothetical protein NONO_c15950 [Nocardia nova SH22a]
MNDKASKPAAQSTYGLLAKAAWLVTFLPGWVLVGLLLFTGLVTAVILIALIVGSSYSGAAEDFRYQCDSALGPDTETSGIETTTTARGAARETQEQPPASDIPTANPYAEMTVDPDDPDVSQWQRDCIAAMASAPYQLPESQAFNTGPAVDCARQLAMSLVGQPVGGAAVLSKNVIYQASAGAATGRCAIAGAEPAPVAGGCDRTPASVGQTPALLVVLPDTVAAQGVCGQRVDPAAASAGDLVFWDYRRHAPTRVGIAVGSQLMVTVDPATGGVVESVFPSGGGVRVKRVLGSSS